MHTSPLAQPGTGDGGGMNVYVRELGAALARAGVSADIYTRADGPEQPDTVNIEPGLRVHYIDAGPREHLDKAELPFVVDEFAYGVLHRLAESPADAIHANYWLSGIAGHELKHRLELPLVSTFHTLDRVKAEDSDDAFGQRAEAEAAIIGCSDAILASCAVEAAQLRDLYDADPTRIEIVAPGVDHAFFAPGDRGQARRALALAEDGPLVLFVGRIQPLKGLDVAVQALALMPDPTTRLVVVGGPSGPEGDVELRKVHALVDQLRLSGRVLFVPPQRHELLSTYYRAADVTVVPSRSESFGLVALESSACGTPVVASAVGGLTTLVDHGATGFLVEGRDPNDFAAYIAKVLDDAQLADAFGHAAAHRAGRYTWSIAAARLRRLYADLTSRSLVDCA